MTKDLRKHAANCANIWGKQLCKGHSRSEVPRLESINNPTSPLLHSDLLILSSLTKPKWPPKQKWTRSKTVWSKEDVGVQKWSLTASGLMTGPSEYACGSHSEKPVSEVREDAPFRAFHSAAGMG